MEQTPGQQSYSGSEKNGVETSNYGSWSGSFVFHGSSKPPTPEPTEVLTQKTPGSLIQQTRVSNMKCLSDLVNVKLLK